MDLTAKVFSNAPTVWLLEQDRDISVCFGAAKDRLRRPRVQENMDRHIEKAFVKLITVPGDTPYTKAQMNDLYLFLWAKAPKTIAEKAKCLFNGLNRKANC